MSSGSKRVEEYGVRTVKGRWSEWSMDENGPECYTDAAGTSGLSMEDLAWLIEPYREALLPEPSTPAAKADDGWIDECQRLADKADNCLHTARLPLPPHIHVEGLNGALEEIRDALLTLIATAPPKPTEGGDGGA